MNFNTENTLLFNDTPTYLKALLTMGVSNKPFLMNAAMNGVKVARALDFDMSQVFDVGTGEQTGLSENNVVAGVAATRATRVKEQNSVQLFQKIVDVSYVRESVTTGLTNLGNEGNSQSPLSFQVDAALKKFQADWDYSALRGARVQGVDSTTLMKMGGIYTAAAAGVNGVDLAAAALSFSAIDSLLAAMYTSGAPMTRPTFVVDAATKVKIATLAAAVNKYIPNVQGQVGLAVSQIATNFGILDIIVDVNMAPNTILVADMALVHPVYVPVKGTDILVEPLAKSGASDKYQVYGQLSIDYGSANAHGALKNFS
jgi:hypothetical protein